MLTKSDDELARFSDRLLHEIQVFFRVGRSLVRAEAGFVQRPTWETHTALVESFAVHTRALADFLFTRRRKKDRPNDGYAIDFFDDASTWMALAGDPGPWLRQVRVRADKDQKARDRFGEQIGHLNYVLPPVSDYARGWPIVQLTREVGTTVRHFIDTVPERRVRPRFSHDARRELPVASQLENPLLAMALWTSPVSPQRLP